MKFAFLVSAEYSLKARCTHLALRKPPPSQMPRFQVCAQVSRSRDFRVALVAKQPPIKWFEKKNLKKQLLRKIKFWMRLTAPTGKIKYQRRRTIENYRSILRHLSIYLSISIHLFYSLLTTPTTFTICGFKFISRRVINLLHFIRQFFFCSYELISFNS